MPNRHGDLNITEAAAYLGVAPDILTSLHDADGGPQHYPEKCEQPQFADGPWFPKWALDQYRPILWAEIGALLPRLEIVRPAGAAKSTLPTHLPPGAAILSA